MFWNNDEGSLYVQVRIHRLVLLEGELQPRSGLLPYLCYRCPGSFQSRTYRFHMPFGGLEEPGYFHNKLGIIDDLNASELEGHSSVCTFVQRVVLEHEVEKAVVRAFMLRFIFHIIHASMVIRRFQLLIFRLFDGVFNFNDLRKETSFGSAVIDSQAAQSDVGKERIWPLQGFCPEVIEDKLQDLLRFTVRIALQGEAACS